jgi:hypothetical protein
MNTTQSTETLTITCKCRKHCNGGRSAIVPAKLVADLREANGGKFAPHFLVANAHDPSNLGRLTRERLNISAV